MWDSATLRGKSVERARLYGMPHVGAKYTCAGTKSYERYLDICPVCGRPAVNTHHEPPRGIGGGGYLALAGIALRPALIALCRECHEKRHAHELTFTWEWDDDIFEEMWSTGFLLEDYEPHDEALYEFGCWAVYKDGKKIREIRL